MLTHLALNILDTLKALKRPPRVKRKPSSTSRVRFEDDQQGPGESEAWQPVKRLSPVKREYWRALLQNWVAWAAFVWIEPWLNRLGIVVPFYGWFKVLFLLYLCLTRPSGGAVLYQSLIAPRLQKHTRTIDLSASFVFLLGECIIQLGLMVLVLPFVAVWAGVKRAVRVVVSGAGSVRRGFFRRKRVGKGVGQVEDVVENLTVEMDEEIQIRVTIASPSIRATFVEHQASSQPAAPSTPTSAPKATTSTRRASLLPSSQEITAYTLSSPQTLRRAVHQAREIFTDSQGRDQGKKRGDDLARGLMKRRVGELEEKRARATSSSAPAGFVAGKKTAGKLVPPVVPTIGDGRFQLSHAPSSAAEPSTTAPKGGAIQSKPTTATAMATAAVPLVARATATRGRTRLVGRAGQVPGSRLGAHPTGSTSVATGGSSSSSSTAAGGRGGGAGESSAGPVGGTVRSRSGASRALSARDSLLTRNSSAVQGQLPARDSSSTNRSSAAPGPRTRTISALTRDARISAAAAASSAPLPPPIPYGYVAWPGQPSVPSVPNSGYRAGAQYVARDGPSLPVDARPPAVGGQVVPSVRPVPLVELSVQPASSLPRGQPVPLARPAQPLQVARPGARGGARSNGSVTMPRRGPAVPALTTLPLSRVGGVSSASTAMQSRIPARQEVATNPTPVAQPEPPSQPAQTTKHVQPVQAAPSNTAKVVQPVQQSQVVPPTKTTQPVVEDDRTKATTPITRDPAMREDVAASGSSSSTQATSSTTVVENLSGAAIATPVKPVRDLPNRSPVISELESRDLSRGLGLGLGDVGTGSTFGVDSEAGTRRANVVPGGYPSAIAESPISVRNSPEGTSDVPVHRLTGYTRPSSASAVRPSSLEPVEDTGPQASTSTGPDRPALRKNNSLGLVTTLESMRSPSLEPTGSFPHVSVGSFESRHSPFFGLQAFPSRLREQAEPMVTTTIQTNHRTLSAVHHPDAQRSRGVFVPVMPLPDMTPATSPVAQCHVPFVAPDPTDMSVAETEKSTEGATRTKASVGKQNEAVPDEKVDEQVPPLSAVSEALEVATSSRRPRWHARSDAGDASPLTSIASLDDDEDADDHDDPSAPMHRRVYRPLGERRVTRAMRPVITQPVGRREERLFRKAARASGGAAGEAIDDDATSSKKRSTRRELPTRFTAKVPDGSRTRTESMPTGTEEEATPGKSPNERKRKEPPSSGPTHPRAIPTVNSKLAAQRPVRPVVPTSVHTRTEFSLPETLIADVTPVRRTRSTAEPRESPTKKRKLREGRSAAAALASQSSMERETSELQLRRRSRRMRPRESA
ncbi:hypothetical protein NCC49_001565 [Naganishia albida]|nr:hypothetical protein NCC49_001565 [Naganishia albida]